MRVFIEGAGEVGAHLATMLRAEGNEITVIDNDEKRLAALSTHADVRIIQGNPSSLDVLRRAEVATADLYIAVYPNAPQEVNLVGALLARKIGAKRVFARVNDEDPLQAENKNVYKDLGIEHLFYPEKSAAKEISQFLRMGYALESTDFARGKIQITMSRIYEDSNLIGHNLGEFVASIPAEQRGQFRIISISRNGQSEIPTLQTRFRHGDHVYSIVKKEGLDNLCRQLGATKQEVKKVMIIGGDSIAAMLARDLHDKHGIGVKIIESDYDRCIALDEELNDDIIVTNGDGRNPDFLLDQGLRDYDAFVALTGNDETNVLACVMAKKYGIPRTVAEVENIDYIHLAEEMGVDRVINKKLLTADRIFRFTLSGNAKFIRRMSGTNAESIEYTVVPGAPVTKKPIKDLNFPQNAIICGYVRNTDGISEASIAVGDTQIEAYDKVTVFALPDTVKELDKFFGKN